jgi:FkbM family methyltransferase
MSNTISASSATEPNRTDVALCACGPKAQIKSLIFVDAECLTCQQRANEKQRTHATDMVGRRLLGHGLPFAAFLGPGDGVIDIGANKGDKTAEFLRIGCNVVAVEPDPDVAESCRQRFRTFGSERVMVNQVAVGERFEPQAYLYRDAVDSRRASLHADNVKESGPWVTVTVVTLDPLVAGIERLRGIKIDAQGSEVAILKGATETLKRRGLVWHVEVWPQGLKNAGSNARELAGLFMQAGYHPVFCSWWQALEWCEKATGHQHLDLVLWDAGEPK